MSDGSLSNTFDPSQVELLFVDDDDEFRSTAVQRFARRGFQVQQAPGVNDALRCCRIGSLTLLSPTWRCRD